MRISLGFCNVQHSWSVERGCHDSWRECPGVLVQRPARGNTGHTEASTLLPEGFNKHCQSCASYPAPYISICKATLPTGVCSGSAVARSWHGCQCLGMSYSRRENGSRYDRDEACSRLPARCHPLWLQYRLQHPTMQLSQVQPGMLFRLQ